MSYLFRFILNQKVVSLPHSCVGADVMFQPNLSKFFKRYYIFLILGCGSPYQISHKTLQPLFIYLLRHVVFLAFRLNVRHLCKEMTNDVIVHVFQKQ